MKEKEHGLSALGRLLQGADIEAEDMRREERRQRADRRKKDRRREAKPVPKRKEKRLINGKWTRDYDDPPVVVTQPNLAAQMMAETPPPVPREVVPPAGLQDPGPVAQPLTPLQQRLREAAIRMKSQ